MEKILVTIDAFIPNDKAKVPINGRKLFAASRKYSEVCYVTLKID